MKNYLGDKKETPASIACVKAGAAPVYKGAYFLIVSWKQQPHQRKTKNKE